MDFFQFLQKSKDNNNNDTNNNNNYTTNNDDNNDTTNNDDNNDTTNNKSDKKSKARKYSINKREIVNETKDETGHVLYKNVKKGNMVRIIYNENSVLNSYKGYIGEIRDYKNEHDFAVIFLHGITNQTFIRFPLKHFVVL
jgi:hypothetical protein